MEPIEKLLLFVVHDDVLVVEGKNDKIQKSGIEYFFGNSDQQETAKQNEGNPVQVFGKPVNWLH
jgi:type II secretory pathway component GspD/PulD (secretin)